MLRLLYSLLRDFGTLGAVIGFGITNFYWIYKIATNHLSHIANDIKDQGDNIKEIQKELASNTNRISNIEGKLSK